MQTPLADEIGQAAAPIARASSGERRQLTILFVDLVAFTALSTRLDPEDLQDTATRFFDVCRGAVQAYDGYLAKFLGDGVLAYFGWPRAREDAAERAIRAAMAIRDGAARLVAIDGTRLAVRCGIATGLAVVGGRFDAGEIEERLVMGETPNLAARLQSLAPPNGVAVSAVTRGLAERAFRFEPMESADLKGFGWRDDIALVTGERTEAEVFEARLEADASHAFVGRDAELRKIEAAWSRAKDGVGQIVGVLGEPGIGKSRLVREARGRIAQAPHLLVRLAGSALNRDTPFQPVIEWLRDRLASNDPLGRIEALRQLLGGGIMGQDDATPLVAELIGLPDATSPTALWLGPDQRRSALIAALAARVVQLSERWPTVILVEDLHWLDASTRALLQAVVDGSARNRLLLIFTSRTPFVFSVDDPLRFRGLTLNRMSAESLDALVAALAGDSLDSRGRARIIERSDGVPLFAEELTRLVLGRGEIGEDRPVPASLSDLLAERIDGLGSAKAVVQLASVLGAGFDLDVLGRLAQERHLDVASGLDRALEQEVLLTTAASSATFRFRHALLRDAAYNSLLRSERRDIHREAAVVLRDSYPDRVKERPEVLAEHWRQGGERLLSIDAWADAGRLAMNRRALVEAEHAYEQALAITGDLPEGPDRAEREVGLTVAYFRVVSQLHGYSGAKTRSVQTSMDALARADGSLRDRFNQILGRWMVVSSLGEHDEALTLADQLLLVAKAMGGDGPGAAAHTALMTSRLRTGDLRGAEAAFTSGERFWKAPGAQPRTGVIPQVYGNAASLARMLGNPDDAQARLAELERLAEETQDPFELAYARFMLATPLLLMGQGAAAMDSIQQVVALSDRHGYKQFQWQARIILGRLQAEMDDPVAGLKALSEALDTHVATGARTGLPFYLLLLAEAQVFAGREADAMTTLDQALGANPQEVETRPDILLLRGDLHRGAQAFDRARGDYAIGLTLSTKMGAVLHEGRFRKRLEQI